MQNIIIHFQHVSRKLAFMCRKVGDVVCCESALNKADRNMVCFGRRVRELRLSKGWLQKDLALKINSESSFISKVECGYFPNLGNLYLTRFAMAFDMEVHELLKPNE